LIQQDLRQALRDVKSLAADGDHGAAFRRLTEIARPDHEFALQSRYAKLFDNSIDAGSIDLKPLRLAILPTSTVDHLADVLRFWLAAQGFRADIHIGQFDTVTQTVLDGNSELYRFKPDVVWFFGSGRDPVLDVAPGAAEADIAAAVDRAVGDARALWSALADRHPCDIIHNNADIADFDLFGNFAGGAPWTRRNLLRRYNLALAAAAPPGVAILDLDHLSAFYGKGRWFDRRYWYHSKHAVAFDAVGRLAYQAARLVAALKGLAKKCLILDLDNTLWGGVVADDGLDGIRLGDGPDGEAFVDFQKFVRGLKDRGLILAVSSKNEDDIAREPFQRHPDMQLGLEDIAVFRANWYNKADNIRDIVKTLNIGMDSVVYVDDNPVERALVREQLPEVAVPDMPQDPAQFIPTLCRELYFETTAFSVEDTERGRYYRDNVARDEHRQSFTDLNQFLKNLEMRAIVGAFDDFHLPRIAQLINKSNQFHLTGTRYGEDAIRAIMKDPKKICRYFKLRDRFGDNGLVSVVILDCANKGGVDIDTWVMSCRVLSRGMEEFICNELVRTARDAGGKTLRGRYVRSKKNNMVADLYGRLGFSKCGEGDGVMEWELAIDSPPFAHPCHIEIEQVAA